MLVKEGQERFRQVVGALDEVAVGGERCFGRAGSWSSSFKVCGWRRGPEQVWEALGLCVLTEQAPCREAECPPSELDGEELPHAPVGKAKIALPPVLEAGRDKPGPSAQLLYLAAELWTRDRAVQCPAPGGEERRCWDCHPPITRRSLRTRGLRSHAKDGL